MGSDLEDLDLEDMPGEDELFDEGEADRMDVSGVQEGGSDEDEEFEDGSARAKSKAKSKGKSKARAKGKNVGGGGKRTKKDGMKFCPACQKWLPIESFPRGSGQCFEDRQAIQNLRAAAAAQGKKEWLEEQLQNPQTCPKILQAYHNRCPKDKETGKRAKGNQFVIAQYQEEVRQETAVILDGVYEMMHLAHFIYWAGKPKNGSMPPDEAKEKWWAYYEEPDAIIDELGPNKKYSKRVAIKKADLVKFRDAQITSKGYTMKDKEIKKASQEDMDKLDKKMGQAGWIHR